MNGSGRDIDCLFNCSGNFGLAAAARSGAPVLVARPAAPRMPAVMPMIMVPQMGQPAGGLPAGVVQCSFSGDVTLLAKSVSDCETAGGEVQQQAEASDSEQSSN